MIRNSRASLSNADFSLCDEVVRLTHSFLTGSETQGAFAAWPLTPAVSPEAAEKGRLVWDYFARCLLRFWECCFFPGLSKPIHCFAAARCGCPVPSEEIEFIYLNQSFPSPSVTLHSRAQYRDLITALFCNTGAVVGEVQRGVARLRSLSLSLWLGFPKAGAPVPQTGPSISSKAPDRPAPQAHPSDGDDSLVQRAEHIPAGTRTPMCGHCNMVIRSDICSSTLHIPFNPLPPHSLRFNSS